MGDAHGILVQLVTQVAEAGRLRMSVEAAAAMIHAAGVGVTVALISADAEGRLNDYEGLSENTRDAVLTALVTDAEHAAAEDTRSARGARHAVALKALLDEEEPPFTPGEHALLNEWLTRLASQATPTQGR
jgi:hypothetical protein